MPLELHADCKSRLIDALATAIPQIEIEHGWYASRRSTGGLTEAELALPKNGKIFDKLLACVGDRPFADYITDILQNELRANIEYDPSTKKLIGIPGYQEPREVAENWVASFESLPFRYRLSTQLPFDLLPILGDGSLEDFSCGPQFKISKTGSAAFIQQHPMPPPVESLGALSLSGLFGGNDSPRWSVAPNAAYIQMDVSGYIDTYGTTTPYAETERMLKAFYGLGIALQLFKIGHVYFPSPPKSHFIVHKLDANGFWQFDKQVEMEDELSRSFAMLKMSIPASQDPERWKRLVRGELQAVFSSDKLGEKILLASQWLFDSYVGRDELLAYVQAMVVLEILLGEKSISDEIGLGELLRNRCAYLIGDSQEDRSELLRSFNDIYRVRSQIVHSGKHRLTMDERVLAARLKWMCRRVIQKEVDLLKANHKVGEIKPT